MQMKTKKIDQPNGKLEENGLYVFLKDGTAYAPAKEISKLLGYANPWQLYQRASNSNRIKAYPRKYLDDVVGGQRRVCVNAEGIREIIRHAIANRTTNRKKIRDGVSLLYDKLIPKMEELEENTSGSQDDVPSEKIKVNGSMKIASNGESKEDFFAVDFMGTPIQCISASRKHGNIFVTGAPT